MTSTQLEELDKVLHNNVKEHPERTDATYERVIEVLESVLNEDALATAIMILEDSIYSNGCSIEEPQSPMTRHWRAAVKAISRVRQSLMSVRPATSGF